MVGYAQTSATGSVISRVASSLFRNSNAISESSPSDSIGWSWSSGSIERRTPWISFAIAAASRAGRSAGSAASSSARSGRRRRAARSSPIRPARRKAMSPAPREGLEPLPGIEAEHAGAAPVGGQHLLHRGQSQLRGDHREAEIGEELRPPHLGPWTPVDPDRGQTHRPPVGDQAIDPRVRGRVGAPARVSREAKRPRRMSATSLIPGGRSP